MTAAAFEDFGFSVAISGDTAIVGALLDYDNEEDSVSANHRNTVCSLMPTSWAASAIEK